MTTHTSNELPPTYRGLQFSSATEPGSVVDIPTPSPTPGSIIVKPLISAVPSYAKEIFAGGNIRGYKYPLPLVPGTNAIGRIAAVGPDILHLRVGMLVFTSGVVRPRDNSNASPTLQGIHMGMTTESQGLMTGEWRNGTWGELARVPAETVHILNEDRLLRELGYKVEDLAYLSTLAVAYGGLSDVGFRPGETVLVAPATGQFGSAAVLASLAMGAAKVIAMGRDREKLHELLDSELATAAHRVVTVPMSGNVETDTEALRAEGPIDVYFDISPAAAANASYIKAAFTTLPNHGRVSMMGGIPGDVHIPYAQVMFKSLSIKGTFMYTSHQIEGLIKLVEAGMLPLGQRGGISVSGRFSLDEWEAAFESAHNNAGPRRATYFAINEAQ